jgi:hypothetical protein
LKPIFLKANKKTLDNKRGSCVIERLLESGREVTFSVAEY